MFKTPDQRDANTAAANAAFTDFPALSLLPEVKKAKAKVLVSGNDQADYVRALHEAAALGTITGRIGNAIAVD